MTQPAASGCSCHVRIAVFDKAGSSINLKPTHRDNAHRIYESSPDSIRVRTYTYMFFDVIPGR